jgi:hypothetical protein
MGVTKQIPRAEWQAYFEHFTRRHLEGDGDLHKAAVIEVLSPTFGDQVEATLMPILGMTYDLESSVFELALEDLDHLVFNPTAIWVIEEEDGFVSTLEVARADGATEIITLRQSGPLALRQEMPQLPEG